MTFEGSYPRLLREAGTRHRIWIRRARCASCDVSHALLPDFVAWRRRDSVDAIGAALTAPLADRGHEPAERLWRGVPARTVRSWRQRFGGRAELLTAGAMAVCLDRGQRDAHTQLPVERGAVTVALVALGALWWTASRRRPGRVPGLWRLANVIVGSHLLSTRTDLPWAGVTGVPQPARGPCPAGLASGRRPAACITASARPILLPGPRPQPSPRQGHRLSRRARTAGAVNTVRARPQ